MERVTVTLTPEEMAGLVHLCDAEMRSLPSQIRAIVRKELVRRRLLQSERKGQDRAVRT